MGALDESGRKRVEQLLQRKNHVFDHELQVGDGIAEHLDKLPEDLDALQAFHLGGGASCSTKSVETNSSI